MGKPLSPTLGNTSARLRSSLSELIEAAQIMERSNEEKRHSRLDKLSLGVKEGLSTPKLGSRPAQGRPNTPLASEKQSELIKETFGGDYKFNMNVAL